MQLNTALINPEGKKIMHTHSGIQYNVKGSVPVGVFQGRMLTLSVTRPCNSALGYCPPPCSPSPYGQCGGNPGTRTPTHCAHWLLQGPESRQFIDLHLFDPACGVHWYICRYGAHHVYQPYILDPACRYT